MTLGPWRVAIYKPDGQSNPTVEELKDWLSRCVDKTIEHGDSIPEYYTVLTTSDDIEQDPVFTAIVGNGPNSKANAQAIAELPNLILVLKRIINDLPAKRDWLDPEIKRAARELLKKVGAE